MLLACALCVGQSVEAVSLRQKSRLDSEGALSDSSVLPPLAALLKSKLSEMPPTTTSLAAVTAVPTTTPSTAPSAALTTTPSAALTAVPTNVAVGLSGYISRQISGNPSCTWEIAQSLQLNYCTKEPNVYTRLTATSTTEATQFTYTDSKCATTPKSYETIPLGICSGGQRYVYSPTKTPESTRPFAVVT